MATPAVGDPAPDFDLPGLVLADGEVRRDRYRLGSRSPGPLVLAFYPGDDTPVCTRQMCSYSSGLEGLTDLGAEVWGVSTQDLDSHERFARKHDLRLPLLADADRAVSRAYGLVRLGGLHTARAVFVLDAAGTVRWRHVSTLGVTYQSTRRLAAVVAGLGMPATG